MHEFPTADEAAAYHMLKQVLQNHVSLQEMSILATSMACTGLLGDRCLESCAAGSTPQEVVAAILEWLKRGVSMFFFPEGTRSEDGRLREFKVGAFKLAIEEGVAICPVVLCGTHEMMKKNSGIPRAAHLILDVMPKVWPLPEETPEAFAERVRSLIDTRLRYLESIR